MEVLEAVQSTWIATELRASRWVYPVVNTGHIMGIALLFGAIVPLDLRLMGFWRAIPTAMLSRVLVPMAAVGVATAVVTGALLFSVHAVQYAKTTLFLVKMLIVAAAIANAVLVGRAALRLGAEEKADAGPPGRLRVVGLISAGLWLAAILCGRMIAYV